MTMTLSGTSGITFPSTAVQGDAGIGFGQTWQSVSRVANTTYTNSTGKPIMVAICNGANNVVMYVNTGAGNIKVGDSGSYANTYTIVPNGATYTSSSVGVSWTELR